jgi:hypothetical protein
VFGSSFLPSAALMVICFLFGFSAFVCGFIYLFILEIGIYIVFCVFTAFWQLEMHTAFAFFVFFTLPVSYTYLYIPAYLFVTDAIGFFGGGVGYLEGIETCFLSAEMEGV